MINEKGPHIKAEYAEGFTHVTMSGDSEQVREMWMSLTKHVLNVGDMTEGQMHNYLYSLTTVAGMLEKIGQLKEQLKEHAGCDACLYNAAGDYTCDSMDGSGICRDCTKRCICAGCTKDRWRWVGDGNQN